MTTFTNTDFTDFIHKTKEAETRLGRHIMSTLRHLARSINNAEKNGVFGIFMNDRRYVYGSIKFMSSILDGLKKSQAWKNLGKLRKLGIVIVEKIKNVHGWVNAYTIDINRFFELFYNNFKEDNSVENTVEADFDGGGSSGERTEGRPVSGLPTHYIYTSLKTTLTKEITVENLDPVDNSDELPTVSNFPTNNQEEISPLGLREEDSSQAITEQEVSSQHCFKGSELLPIDLKPTFGVIITTLDNIMKRKFMKKLILTVLLASSLSASEGRVVSSLAEFYGCPIVGKSKTSRPIPIDVCPSPVDFPTFAETFQQLPPKTIFSGKSPEVVGLKQHLKGTYIEFIEQELWVFRPMPLHPRFNLISNIWEVRYFPPVLDPSMDR